jgi:hypothetical protein
MLGAAEQVNDVDILEQEDKHVSHMSRLFREVQYLSLSLQNLAEVCLTNLASASELACLLLNQTS